MTWKDPASAFAVAEHYRGLLKGFVYDSVDAHLEDKFNATRISTHTTDTTMRTVQDRARLAQDVLHFIGKLQ